MNKTDALFKEFLKLRSLDEPADCFDVANNLAETVLFDRV